MTHLCRFCRSPLETMVANLGTTPWSNSFLEPTVAAIAAERRFPLAVMVCDWPENSVAVKSTEPVAVSVASTQHSAFVAARDSE